MLRCGDGSIYVGHTDDLGRRMAEHQNGTFGGHTARRLPVEIVWSADMPTRDEALQAELQLKGWTRAKKEALARGDWAAVKRLARGPDRRRRSGAAPFDSAPGLAGRYAQGERPCSDSAPGLAGRYAQGERPRVGVTTGTQPMTEPTRTDD
jgi:predicted GIY-YIG superfamily endonuclease